MRNGERLVTLFGGINERNAAWFSFWLVSRQYDIAGRYRERYAAQRNWYPGLEINVQFIDFRHHVHLIVDVN